jgi:anti-anti-sigma factor
MPSQPLAVEYDATARVLRVEGELDQEGTEVLRAAIAEHSQAYTTELAVDLSEVTYCPSVAIGMLVTATKLFRASGTPFELAARTGSMAARVLTLCAISFRAS